MKGVTMAELKPCPFCGGNGKVSFKDHKFCYAKKSKKFLRYRVQVICNRCRSRGKPIITLPLENPNPYISAWGNCYYEHSDNCKKQTEMFEPFVSEAVEAWNRRCADD